MMKTFALHEPTKKEETIFYSHPSSRSAPKEKKKGKWKSDDHILVDWKPRASIAFPKQFLYSAAE